MDGACLGRSEEGKHLGRWVVVDEEGCLRVNCYRGRYVNLPQGRCTDGGRGGGEGGRCHTLTPGLIIKLSRQPSSVSLLDLPSLLPSALYVLQCPPSSPCSCKPSLHSFIQSSQLLLLLRPRLRLLLTLNCPF